LAYDVPVGILTGPIEHSETAFQGPMHCSVHNTAEYKICKPAPQPSPDKFGHPHPDERNRDEAAARNGLSD